MSDVLRPASAQAASSSVTWRRTASSTDAGVRSTGPVGPMVTQLRPYSTARRMPLGPPAAIVRGSGRWTVPGVLGASWAA